MATTLTLPTLEPFLFIVSLAVASLVVMIAWLRRSHLRQRHMLLVYLLLTFSLSLAVVALTDFSNFSLAGKAADTQTGRFLAGLLSFSLISLIAVRLMRNYPLACCWWFVLVAAYTSLPASSLENVAQTYHEAITMIRLLCAAVLFLLICRFKRNLNDHQYLSVLTALMVFIWFHTPLADENLTVTLLTTAVNVLVVALFRADRKNAPLSALVGVVMLLAFGVSNGVTAVFDSVLGEEHAVTKLINALLYLSAAIWIWQRRRQVPHGLFWESWCSFLLLGCMLVLPDTDDILHFYALVGILLLFVTTLYLYAGRDASPAVSGNWRQCLSAAWSGVIFLCTVGIGFSGYTLSVMALENNLSPARILARAHGTPWWPGDKQFVALALADEGLWPGQVGTADDQRLSLDRFIETIRPPADRFSKVRSIDKVRSRDEGIVHSERGFTCVLVGNRCLLQQVAKQSPAGRLNLKRGDRIIAINGVVVGSFKSYQTLYEQSQQGEQSPEMTLKVKGKSGNVRTVTIPLGKVEYDPPISSILSAVGGPVGYLYLPDFLNASFKDIRERFAQFKQAGVRDLVLDLRYNGGGNVAKAQLLASLVAGQSHNGELFTRSVHTYRYPDRDIDYHLERQPESLHTRRLVVLTTDESCSASEVIIAGLRPYLPVYTVGDTTCGKPYMMYPLPFGKSELFPADGYVYTSQGEATYTNGIKADVKIADDLTRELGDPQERMLKAAMQLMESGAFR